MLILLLSSHTNYHTLSYILSPEQLIRSMALSCLLPQKTLLWQQATEHGPSLWLVLNGKSVSICHILIVQAKFPHGCVKKHDL